MASKRQRQEKPKPVVLKLDPEVANIVRYCVVQELAGQAKVAAEELEGIASDVGSNCPMLPDPAWKLRAMVQMIDLLEGDLGLQPSIEAGAY